MFLNQLNSLHSSLTFIHDKNVESKLPFLDVLVEKSDTKFLTSVNRKSKFTGQYIHWDSFGPKSRKTYLIGTLEHRALILSSPSKSHKLNSIRFIFNSNGYPDHVIALGIQKKLP